MFRFYGGGRFFIMDGYSGSVTRVSFYVVLCYSFVGSSRDIRVYVGSVFGGLYIVGV